MSKEAEEMKFAAVGVLKSQLDAVKEHEDRLGPELTELIAGMLESSISIIGNLYHEDGELKFYGE